MFIALLPDCGIGLHLSLAFVDGNSLEPPQTNSVNGRQQP